MLPDTLRQMAKLVLLPRGMILATGSTGIARTTTLYAALQKAYSCKKKVIAIEDPIKYQLDRVRYFQIMPLDQTL